MKKILKPLLIALLSVMTLTLAAIGIIVWFVFTPQKLTPIVRKQAANFLTCQTEIGEVELTFFSTFPNFGLKATQVAFINPFAGAPNDTLFAAKKVIGVIDVKAWWDNKEVVLTQVHVTQGQLNLFTDSLSRSNYWVTPIDTLTETSESKLPVISIQNVELEGLKLSYIDQSLAFNSQLDNLNAQLTGQLTDNHFKGHLKVMQTSAFMEYEGEQYLQGSLVKVDSPVELTFAPLTLTLNDSKLIVNNLAIQMEGSIDIDTTFTNYNTNLTYHFDKWPIEDALALTPPSYQKYLDGIKVGGLISSNGKITGLYNDTLYPLMDIHVSINKGTFNHTTLNLPLKEINGNMTFYSDLANDAISYFKIDQISARTAQSTIEANGIFTHLFSDIHCNINANTNLLLSEFSPLIPAKLKTKLDGRASGKLHGEFTMSQIEKMELEKMSLKGLIDISNMIASYDSITVSTPHSHLELMLPNPKPTNRNARFVSAKLIASSLEAFKTDGFNVKMADASINIESSDMRDTTCLPIMKIEFAMAQIAANMDTLRLEAQNPKGNLGLSPRTNQKLEPIIDVNYQGDKLFAAMGQETVSAKSLKINANIENHAHEKDIWLQWLTNGFVNMEKGQVCLSSFNLPIDIPSIKMDFTPENLHIKEGTVIIDKSDFSLTGHINNVYSYFKGDSILTSDLTFSSLHTDISQLMNLTNGIGSEEPTSSSTGPYMVPLKMDLTLRTDIQKATLGADTISKIQGDVRIMDGLLVLDDIKCSTPATNMQITAMYRSQRRNHLYLGIDYHMFDVDIENLLKMIPDIDTIMPMLKSFKGKAEFHTVSEAYLDSTYNIKKSTIRSSSSIKGNDLVLMDGQTFSEIAKSLKFSKKAVNKVDTLSAEFSIFKNQIDIYPFLIVMDKYKAIVAGRHNLDMTYKYNISVIDCPLPIKLGVDINGNSDDFKYHVTPCTMNKLYRPIAQNLVQKEQLDLRKMMYDALKNRNKRNL